MNYQEDEKIIKIGEFEISKYSEGSILIKKEDGESMELKIETLWDKNY
jgi:hypothetical protein